MQFNAAPAGAEPERKPFSGGIMADGARVRRLTVHRDAGGFDCAEEFERERFRGFELDCRRSRRKAEPGVAERRPAPAGDAQRRVASGQDGAPVQRKPDDGGASGDIACPDRKFVVIEKSGAEQLFKFAGRFAERVAQQELPVKRGRTVLSLLFTGPDVPPVGPLRIRLLHPCEKNAQRPRAELPVHPQQGGRVDHADDTACRKLGIVPSRGVDVTRIEVTEFGKLGLPLPVVVMGHVPFAFQQRAAERHGLPGGDAERKRLGPAVADSPGELRGGFGGKP